MKQYTVMIIAGETSGDTLAAELVRELKPRLQGEFATRFFGAGGSKMAAEGVELAVDMTEQAAVGLWEVLSNLMYYKRIFNQLLDLAKARCPDAIVLVDYSGFNLRFAKAVKRHVRSSRNGFNNWDPKIIYYVSPQVWASREKRVHQIARDIDLMLSIFPFEKDWYAQRAPELPVTFVGHPLVDRYAHFQLPGDRSSSESRKPLVLLLPGSRRRELKAHLPIMLAAARQMEQQQPIRWRMVLPSSVMANWADHQAANGSLPLEENATRTTAPEDPSTLTDVEIRTGYLPESLSEADLAIAASGTVTLECAYFQVPTVVIYKTSWSTYLLGRMLIRVKHLAMPNVLMGEEVFPELIQNDATPENVAEAANSLLNRKEQRKTLQSKLAQLIASLGTPGACRRAAEAIGECLRKSE